MFGLGLPELFLIFIIVLVLFGGSKLPQLGRGLGQGIANFRDGFRPKDKTPPVDPGKK